MFTGSKRDGAFMKKKNLSNNSFVKSCVLVHSLRLLLFLCSGFLCRSGSSSRLGRIRSDSCGFSKFSTRQIARKDNGDFVSCLGACVLSDAIQTLSAIFKIYLKADEYTILDKHDEYSLPPLRNESTARRDGKGRNV